MAIRTKASTVRVTASLPPIMFCDYLPVPWLPSCTMTALLYHDCFAVPLLSCTVTTFLYHDYFAVPWLLYCPQPSCPMTTLLSTTFLSHDYFTVHSLSVPWLLYCPQPSCPLTTLLSTTFLFHDYFTVHNLSVPWLLYCPQRGDVYLSLHCQHQNDSCIKLGSDESRFNVSLIVRDKVTRQFPQIATFEEKGEPKRIRT